LVREGAAVDVRVVARYRLRDAARDLEEICVLLEDAGHEAMPGELRRMSERLLEIRRAVDGGGAAAPPSDAVSP
jgi:hypothetical protein